MLNNKKKITKEQIHRLYAQGLANLMMQRTEKAYLDKSDIKWLESDEYNQARSKYTREFEKEHNVMITDKRIEEKA